MSIRKWLRNWIFKDAEASQSVRALIGLDTGENSGASQSQAPHCRFGVLPVINGKVLEVCTYKRNPHGPDWTTTYWILNEEQPLAEQIATVITMKGLEK